MISIYYKNPQLADLCADEERHQLSDYISTIIPEVRSNRDIESMALDIFNEKHSEERKRYTVEELLSAVDTQKAKLVSEIPYNEQIRAPWPINKIIELVYRMHWRYV